MDALTDQLTALSRVRYMQFHHGETEKRSRASTYPQDSDAGTDKSHLENYTNTEKQNTLIRLLQLLTITEKHGNKITDLTKYNIQNTSYEPKDRHPYPSYPEKIEKWQAEETAFKKYWNTISELVVQEASIIACTHNLTGTIIIKSNFDKDKQVLEPDMLIPLITPNKQKLILGTIRGGDQQQLPPLSITASEVPGYNEFGYQMGRSLFDRLRRSQFPFTLVSEQHRMHPRLSRFPSEFTYNGRMTNDPVVHSVSVGPELSAPGANFKRGMELIGIDVTDGKAVVNGKTRSRSNIANVTVVMELVEFLISRDALKGRTSAIITTYADQRKEYVRSLKKLSERLSIAWKDMIKIATVDSMQGHEVDLAILDWVVDSGAKSHLGFASDNRRTNVALTRARACLIVVANGAILNNDRLSERKPTHLHPEVLAHWNSLFLNGLVVDVRAGLMTSNADGQGEL
ncbi:uncharacterized protein BO96DRAFT_434591 [Aspergillus niger CBS 101883]|uniref:uncharacterized protein n=1 Tax=Aspergillus lacticoffeatus (strain CBS 101883) TaxID=1450533 RepID=UPI000D7F7026|nr:uncharacterized protein BO96DRAFT_434591 [Aspergillus niger CBS 101883]PYH56116.1 hypothetical protein BO96DRAFT_434591 [Aspergillus niger CBS 101883]